MDDQTQGSAVAAAPSKRASAGRKSAPSEARQTRVNVAEQKIEPPMRTRYEQVAGNDDSSRAGMHTVIVPTVDVRPGYRSPVAKYKDDGYVVLNTGKDELVNSADVMMGIPQEEYDRRENERVRSQNAELGYRDDGKPADAPLEGDTRAFSDDMLVGTNNRVQRKAAISLAQAAKDLPDS